MAWYGCDGRLPVREGRSALRAIAAILIPLVPWLFGRAFMMRLLGVGPGFSFPVGVALLSTALGFVGLAGGLAWPLLPWILIGLAGISAWLQRRTFQRWRPEPTLLPAWALVAMILLHSLSTPINGFDAIAMWSAKGRGFFTSGSVLQTLSWPVLQHRDYPFLSSLLECWAYIVRRTVEDETLAKLYQPLLLGSLATALHGYLLDLRGRVHALVFPLLLVASPMVAEMASQNWADLPLAVWNALAAIAACRLLQSGDRRWLWVLGICGGAMVATKLEGALLLLAFAAPTGWLSLRRFGFRVLLAPSLGALLAMLVVAAPWISARLWLDLSSEYERDLDPGFVLEGVGPLAQARRAAGYMWRNVVESRTGIQAPGAYALLFPYLFVVGVVSLRRSSPQAARLLVMAVGLQLIVYLCVFTMSPYRPEDQLPVAVDRLMLHIAPLALVAAAVLTPKLDGRDRV